MSGRASHAGCVATERGRRAVVGRAALGAALIGVAARPGAAGAQDRLLDLRAAGTGVEAEGVSFGAGAWQAPLPGQDSVRIRSASQLTIPLTAAVPIGRFVTVDATTLYATSTVRYDRADASGVLHQAHASMSGLSDVRVRLTARLFDERLVVTAGANAPTGRTSLDSAQLLTARVLAAPAVGFGAPPIGAGPSGTLGVLTAQRVGMWAVAAGVSYEHRGSYAPVTALIAGLSSLDFTPGDVMHVSVAGDGLLGRGRLSMTLATDFFRRDRLRGGVLGVGVSSTEPSAPQPSAVETVATVATVQLGPVVSADVQYHAPVPAVRDLVFYTGVQYRAPYARDGVRLTNTNTAYLNGGVRTLVPLAPGRDAFIDGGVRFSSGIATGGGLTTARYTAGAVTAGVSQRVRRLVAQPYLRAQVGRVIGRGLDAQHDASFGGGAAGLALLTRF
ncbi:MAG TPA: hypothetical protein VGD56_03740 [Gemmatirosa sp.]